MRVADLIHAKCIFTHNGKLKAKVRVNNKLAMAMAGGSFGLMAGRMVSVLPKSLRYVQLVSLAGFIQGAFIGSFFPGSIEIQVCQNPSRLIR